MEIFRKVWALLPTGSAAEKLRVLVSIAGLVGIFYSLWLCWHGKDPATVLQRVERNQLESKRLTTLLMTAEQETARRTSHNLARNFYELGAAYWEQGKLDDAEKMFKRAILHYEEIGNFLAQAVIYMSLGSIYISRENFDTAEEMLLKSLATCKNLKNFDKHDNLYIDIIVGIHDMIGAMRQLCNGRC